MAIAWQWKPIPVISRSHLCGMDPSIASIKTHEVYAQLEGFARPFDLLNPVSQSRRRRHKMSSPTVTLRLDLGPTYGMSLVRFNFVIAPTNLPEGAALVGIMIALV